MDYRIVSFNAQTGTLSVNFHTPSVPEGLTYSVDLPIVDGEYLAGPELDTLIQSFAPVAYLERLGQLRTNPPPAPDVPVQTPLDPILDASFTDGLAYVEAEIDRLASQTRGRFISSGVGQEATYLTKLEQAHAYQAAGFLGEVPPYIQAEATATEKSPPEVAQAIIATATYWNSVVGPLIEGYRIGGKTRARSCTTPQELKDAFLATKASLEAI